MRSFNSHQMSDAPAPEESQGAEAHHFIPRQAIIRLAVGVVAGAIVAGLVSSLAEGIPDSLHALVTASVPWLVLAFAAEVLCYLFIGIELSRLLDRVGASGFLVPVRLGLVLYGLGTLLPGSPAPGWAMATSELKRRGMDTSTSSLALLLSGWFNVRAFLVLTALAAIAALFRGLVPANFFGLVIGATAFLVAGLMLTAEVVKHPAVGERAGALLERLNWRGSGAKQRQTTEQLHQTAMTVLRSREDSTVIGFAAFGSWIADLLCLRLALIATGVHASMSVILIAYVISMLVSLVPLMPAGLGLVELTVPAVLHHYGYPVEGVLAGTLAWRALALFLPALAGLVAYSTLRMQPIRAIKPSLKAGDPARPR
jgi:uncharacterized protein (TIRG00374 family)